MKSITLNLLRLCCALLAGNVGFGTSAPTTRRFIPIPRAASWNKLRPTGSQVTIHHQAIPGYMMEMTMDFPVKDTNELNGISRGDKITFTLVVNETNDWVENIHRIGHTDEITTKRPMHMTGGMFTGLKPGDLLPDGELLTENGRQIHLSDFRGKGRGLHVFFHALSAAELLSADEPEFCRQARDLILAMTNAPANWQFLSISFDPEFDTPELLSNYAGSLSRRKHQPAGCLPPRPPTRSPTWRRASDLMVMRQGGNISHNLRTVVLDPQGRIYRQFNGNEWTPQQLADAVVGSRARNHQLHALIPRRF